MIWARRARTGASVVLLVLLGRRTTTTCVSALSTTSPSSSRPSSSSSLSIAARVQQSQTVADLLQVAASDDFWLPTDDGLAVHLRRQRVHHEKRQRWAAQWLTKCGEIVSAMRHDNYHLTSSSSSSSSSAAAALWNDPRLARAILAASMPFPQQEHNNDDNNNQHLDRPDKEGRYLQEALIALHNILGHSCSGSSHGAGSSAAVVVMRLPRTVRTAMLQLVQRAEILAPSLPLAHAAEMRWACRGIFARCNVLEKEEGDSNHDDDDVDDVIPQLNARVAALPFDIVPQGIDWNEIFPSSQHDHNSMTTTTQRLRSEIPFHHDTIVTRTGTAVTERRGTAWIAEDGIGALAYSGKLMEPQPITNVIRNLMRKVEDVVLSSSSSSSTTNGRDSHNKIITIMEQHYPRPFFDCALCNHYPTNDSACKFHTDPEHGTHWHVLNCVVAAGSPRRFAFRPIPGRSTWKEWEPANHHPHDHDHHQHTTHDTGGGSVIPTIDPHAPAVITLFAGDICVMRGSCNDDFHHAVYPGQTSTNADGTAARREESERVSLVLKRALVRNGGVRGHGLAGQGRRSRRRRNAEVTAASTPEPSATTATTPSQKHKTKRTSPTRSKRRTRR